MILHELTTSLFYQTVTDYLPRLLMGTALVALFWVISIAVYHAIVSFSRHNPPQRYLFTLIAKATKITLLTVGIISGLGSIGINVTAMVTSLGLAGFAISFALKDALSNAIAGLMLLLYQPFKVGDTISSNEIQKSTVTEINLRYTKLSQANDTYLVPNVKLMNSIIKM